MSDWEACEGNEEVLPVTHHNEYVPSPSILYHAPNRTATAFILRSIRSRSTQPRRTRAKSYL